MYVATERGEQIRTRFTIFDARVAARTTNKKIFT
jgi:hypothetical protein